MEELTHASLFTGIGGFDISAEEEGFNNIFQVEINDYCQQILQERFPNAKKYRDIKTFDPTEYKGRIKVLSGGFPCQDISVANPNGKGLEGERSGLWYEFYRIIDIVRPEFIFIENSPNLRNIGLKAILYQLAEIGYNAEWEMLQANFFNGHHKRRRLYIVAYNVCFGRNEKNFYDRFYNEVKKKWDETGFNDL